MLVENLKRRSTLGIRWRITSVSSCQLKGFYIYRDGFYERMGSWAGPANEITITESHDKTSVIIDFKFPNSILLAFALIALFIFITGYLIAPDFGFLRSTLIVGLLYFAALIRLISQFYHFKSDLHQVEAILKKQL
jgi:hypothetical protein